MKAPVLLTDFLPAADHALALMEQAGLALGLPPAPPTTLPWWCWPAAACWAGSFTAA